ncbi:MAU2 chromatid cohesion factor homolog [Aspergillus udagawae]|uniref:MAU2 chromatid cohesion factor homolog n=1 Tax=Aspergillus udagawae TaxID=91492 RepID=A0ABQ1B849_9EURO|nr:MAU2 chromatid cohesion factor homolog [Aspergillus udagawae]GFF35679.1 MAU2 chromatid cohesion factor homolog [Aspergillus udagawae]GFF95809.1 MAU2 chromatid cohesion factor homolog [Aspergillus udagawae]
MVYPFRRAGEKLKTVAKMDTWVSGQSEERTIATKPSTRCYLLELPTELLLEIISHLSVIPETCLALTCKRLFAISGAIFRSVRFSHDFAPLFHHYRNGHNFVTTRWQLINILENSRWWACSKCLKLHSRDAFSSRELRRKPEDRACLLGNFAGIVDLCPCKKLTFRDKMDLVELLKVRQRSVAALQSQFGASIQQRFCWHSCSKDYGPTQLHIEIFPELDDQDQLRIKTEYRLTTESGKLGKEEYITPRFGCAHRSVDLWLSSAVAYPKSYVGESGGLTALEFLRTETEKARIMMKVPRLITSSSSNSKSIILDSRVLRFHDSYLRSGAMNYPPSHNGQYPPQYLQQPQQLLYSNADSNASPYEYGKPVAYPQTIISPYSSYGQAYNIEQHQHQPQSHHQQQQQPPQQQYVNPSDVFQQPLIPPASSSHLAHGSTQYGAQPMVSVAGNSNRSPAVATASTSAQSTQSAYQTAPTPNLGNNVFNQYPQVALPAHSVPSSNSVAAAPPVPSPKPTPLPSSSKPATPVPSSRAAPPVPSASKPAPPVQSKKPLPQVLVPAPSPDVQQKMQRQGSKKQVQRQSAQQPVQKPTKPPIDYQVLLLSLADEYLKAAYGHGTMVASSRREMEIEEYYKLVATGLGCLEAVLKNWRLQPRMEALVRLRYARILFEETENDLEAETALSKGIDLCERNRMLDLKYSMQHLLARMLHKTNPKASLKAVDGMILDVEAYRHSAWEYAFRFLRVSLSLSTSAHQDSVSALQHLHKISNMANRQGDKAVAAISAVIEALAHLQHGTSSDAIEQAQRAVAVARSHQLNDELRHIPQLSTLVQMVDICCSLLEYDINQSSQKLKVMQDLMDERLNDPNWRADGSFSIPLSGKSAGPSSIDTGDILQVQNGTLLLSFNWLPQHDLYALCYFLSSITLSAKNSYDGRKAEKFLQEGIRMVKGSFKAPQEIAESMVNANRRVDWRRILYCNLLLHQVFLACGRTDWDLANQTLKELRPIAEGLGDQLPDTIQRLMEYATGALAQATGDLEAALSIFQSPRLSLSSITSKTARNDPRRDIAILAALNTILILRDPNHPSHSNLPSSLALVESFCKGSPNKYIQAAYYLVCATVHTESTIQTKQYLQQALQSATAISNSQITCMTLTFMSWKYFRGVVGEQAEKSARAGRAMAKKANDRLWVSVTDEMLAETLERQGKSEEAEGVRDEGHRVMTGLPPALKRPV